MLNFSQEWIATQVNDYFVEEGTKIVERICDAIDNGAYKSNANLYKKSNDIQALIRLIKERFGITVDIPKSKSTDVIGSHALPPIGRVEEILYHHELSGFSPTDFRKIEREYESFQKKQKQMASEIEDQKGEVSFKTAKVSGYLSEIPSLLGIDFYNHRKNHDMTPRQILAVTLHEIGHIFHGLAHRHYTDVVNLSLQNFAKEMNNNNPEKALYHYNKRMVNAGLEPADNDSELPREDLALKVFLSSVKNIRVISHDLAYQRTFSENSADAFATRMGLGVELSQALEQMGDAMTHPSPLLTTCIVFGFTVLFSVYIAIVVMGPLFSFSGPLIPGLILAMNTFILSQSGVANRIDAYDNDKDRFQRILNNMVRELKKAKNEYPEMIPKMIKDIQSLQVIVNRTKPGDWELYYDRIANLLFVKNRKAVRVKNIQRNIENMAANTLFVQSFKLLEK